MNKNLKLRDRIEIYRKHNRSIHGKDLIKLLIICVLILILGTYLRSSYKGRYLDYESSALDHQQQITFLGDIVLGGRVEQVGNRYGYENLFRYVEHIWKDSDFVVSKFNSAILSDELSIYRDVNHRIHRAASQNSVSTLVGQVDKVSLASYRNAEFGEAGVLSTVGSLRDAGIYYVGAGSNLTDVVDLNVINIDGLNVVFLGVSDIIPEHGTVCDDSAGILTTSYNGLNRTIFQASQLAELVVVFVHWGERGAMASPTIRQRDLAREFIDAGADIIIGGNPSVLQPIEFYNEGVIFYSLGDLISDESFSRRKESIAINFIHDHSNESRFEILFLNRSGAIPFVTNNLQTGILTRMLESGTYTVSDNVLTVNFPRRSIQLSE